MIKFIRYLTSKDRYKSFSELKIRDCIWVNGEKRVITNIRETPKEIKYLLDAPCRSLGYRVSIIFRDDQKYGSCFDPSLMYDHCGMIISNSNRCWVTTEEPDPNTILSVVLKASEKFCGLPFLKNAARDAQVPSFFDNINDIISFNTKPKNIENRLNLSYIN